MRKKIKQYITIDTIPYIIVLTLFFIIHVKMNTNSGDDVVLRNERGDILESVIGYYYSWGSPSLLFILNRYLPRIPDIYFKICDILVILLIQYSVSKITDNKNSKYTKFIIVFLIMLYPFMQMNTAGWIATTTTYLFPLAFGLYSFVYLKLIVDNKEINKLTYVLFWFSLVLGAGGLQLSFIIFGIYFLFNIGFIIKRKIYKFSIVQNITALIAVVYHLTAPGNANRSIQETITWFPDFNMISTVNKIKLGFTSTLGDLISGPNLFFLCFSFLLVIGVYSKYKNIFYRAISLIPLVSSVIFGVFSNVFLNIFHDLVSLMNNGAYDFIQINIYNYEQKINYLSIILGFVILGAIITSIYLIFENTLKMITVEMIFLAGFSSRMIMSFSPTIYASLTRTFIYLYFAMIVCGGLIYNNISENIEEEKQKNILLYIGIVAAINYLQLLINI